MGFKTTYVGTYYHLHIMKNSKLLIGSDWTSAQSKHISFFFLNYLPNPVFAFIVDVHFLISHFSHSVHHQKTTFISSEVQNPVFAVITDDYFVKLV